MVTICISMVHLSDTEGIVLFDVVYFVNCLVQILEIDVFKFLVLIQKCILLYFFIDEFGNLVNRKLVIIGRIWKYFSCLFLMDDEKYITITLFVNLFCLSDESPFLNIEDFVFGLLCIVLTFRLTKGTYELGRAFIWFWHFIQRFNNYITFKNVFFYQIITNLN